MAILELTVLFLAFGFILTVGVSLFIVFFIYTHFKKKLKHKADELTEEFQNNIARVNNVGFAETKELRKRVEAVEEKLDALLQPEGDAKEVAKEKVKVHARK